MLELNVVATQEVETLVALFLPKMLLITLCLQIQYLDLHQ